MIGMKLFRHAILRFGKLEPKYRIEKVQKRTTIMTEQELREKIKEKFNSVCEKIFRLESEYSNDYDVLASLSVIAFKVGAVFAEAHIQLTEGDERYPHVSRVLSQRTNSTQPVVPKLKPMTLQECYNFMERTDKALDLEENIMKMADQIERDKK